MQTTSLNTCGCVPGEANAKAAHDCGVAERSSCLPAAQPSIEEAVFGSSDDEQPSQSDGDDSGSDLDDLIDALNAGRKVQPHVLLVHAGGDCACVSAQQARIVSLPLQ